MELERVKNWLYLDHDLDDELVENLIASAKSELEMSGVPPYSENEKGYALYCIAVKYIISRDFETRGYIESNSYNKQFNEKALQSMILKLKQW
ncbi:phage gp6-like head-tail connector protein [Staphylococcus muscae]|uniref:Phage gp6-like head-tail connector family protein n=1 Tax=Staphylococcus muscae TaxID=1294 RepID=A0A240BYC7_9STAP|nr:head-tail connector protein [Staphylococcus muscae]AVQ34419.1 phage gp6-like head-tail connector protein [Staphylococcus muscae]PNZ03548.1 phage gp6-like head-tail connector protein [Staphylococcus muscae]GGA93247.1 phage head-tail adapter protein [Staphylococcus muscae]SNW00714.1 phage gp6-like head-tail connector family protein [Staphylococcus muscae]